jgi:hypothetical protein
MTPYKANPFIYVFSVAAIAGVLLYYVYGAVDRAGLEVSSATATVAEKQFTESGKSYYTTVAGGQAFVQSQETPETYAVVLSFGDERTAGVVPQQLYASLKVDDSVQVKYRRTRISNKLEVLEITR